MDAIRQTRSATPTSAVGADPVHDSTSSWRRFRLLGSLLLLLVIAAAVYSELLSLRLNDAVSRMQAVREAMDENRRLLGYAVDLESGHRGYLLTGDRRHLENYAAADRALPAQIERLETLLGGSPELATILDRMKAALVAKRDEMARVQTSFEHEGRMAVLASYGQDLGKYEMDSLRTGGQAIESVLTRAALNQRAIVHRLSDRQTLSMRVMLAVAALIGVAALFLGARHFDALRRQERLVGELVRSRKRSEDKTAFLAHVSHEIRTPMNAIFGFSGLLQDRLQDPVNRRYIDAITSSAHALLGIINDLLDLSAIEAGKVTMARRPGDLRGVVDGVHSLFVEQAAAKQLRLDFRVDPEVPAAVLMDADRVRQMLVNLVGNAVKYTDRGYVQVSVRAEPGRAPGTATCVAEVRDSGRGIRPADQERIFEPFARCGPQEGPHGTGLGLSITRQLARAMGGDVKVRSEPGRGSNFTLTLPDLELAGAASAACTAGLRLRDLPAFRALAVDDVELNLDVLKALFADTPHQLRGCAGGAEALALLRDWTPDVVLIDIRMAGMDGQELARRLRDEPRTRGIRRVAITASKLKPRPEDADLFDGVLLKPVDERALAQELAHVLRAEPAPAAQAQAAPQKPAPPPELVAALRELLDTRWRAVSGTLTIAEVRAFAEQVAALARRYPVDEVRRYGNTLLAAVAGFDVVRIEAQLAGYPALVSTLDPGGDADGR